MEANTFVNWIKDLNENSSSCEIFKLAKYDFLKFCNEYKAFEITEGFKEPDKNDVLEFIKKINIFILRRGLKIIKTINQKTTKTIENLLNEIDKKNKVSLY